MALKCQNWNMLHRIQTHVTIKHVTKKLENIIFTLTFIQYAHHNVYKNLNVNYKNKSSKYIYQNSILSI